MKNVPYVERSELLSRQIAVERSIIALHTRTPLFARISKVETTRILNAAHEVLCSAIEKASTPGNDSLAYTDIGVSIIRSVNKSRLPGAKLAAREMAYEFMLNAREMLDVCTTNCERNFRADHIIHALELTR